jgi:hypothetical protein
MSATGYPARMDGSSEADVAADPHVAASRETGGADRDGDTRDGPATTGTDENETFVGRVAGQDAGYAGETGAEARARSADEERSR